jgi:hypothetical protein
VKTVLVYGFQGRFHGRSAYEFVYPAVGDTHKCLLFIAQENPGLDFEGAIGEALKFGFVDLQDLRGNPLKVEVLNTSAFSGFAGFYEEALQIGSALVYYPNS